jgi:hypothetical protein
MIYETRKMLRVRDVENENVVVPEATVQMTSL